MILRRADHPFAPRDTAQAAAMGALDRQSLSDAGGLTQFGAFVEVLHPGARSSDRHWHSMEDEMVFVIAGAATVVDDAGPRAVNAGQAVCWPAGVANAHHLVNRGGAPCTYLVAGSRLRGDVVRYPDLGRTQREVGDNWQVEDAAGQVMRGGPLPDYLLHACRLPLPEQGRAPLPPLVLTTVKEPDPVHPVLGRGPGPYAYALIGDPGGLTQFGVHLEILPPGSKSGFCHWHETEDEMVYVLTGSVMLAEDTETPLQPGDAACWPAGTPIGHCLKNRGAADASYLTIGTRNRADVIHYPDHDLITEKDGPARRYTRRDGSPVARSMT